MVQLNVINILVKRLIFLASIIFLLGCSTNRLDKNREPNLPIADKSFICNNEKLKLRLISFDYDVIKGFIEFDTTYTNLCNKKYYIQVNDPLALTQTYIYFRNDKANIFTKNLNVDDPDYFQPYLSMPGDSFEMFNHSLEPYEDWEYGGGFYIKKSQRDLEKDFLNKNSFYVLVEFSYSLPNQKIIPYEEEILNVNFVDVNYNRVEPLWKGRKSTLSKCTFTNEKDGVRHYTCEFVKNVLKEEDKWAK